MHSGGPEKSGNAAFDVFSRVVVNSMSDGESLNNAAQEQYPPQTTEALAPGTYSLCGNWTCLWVVLGYKQESAELQERVHRGLTQHCKTAQARFCIPRLLDAAWLGLMLRFEALLPGRLPDLVLSGGDLLRPFCRGSPSYLSSACSTDGGRGGTWERTCPPL